jgi:Tol biopolymer transport system component
LEFEGGAEEGGGRVRTIDGDGEHDRTLTEPDELMTWDPSWGPDGRSIVFVASRIDDEGQRSDTEVAYRYLSRPNVRFLTDNQRFEWGPDWN